jgi:PKD repeat protein
MMNGWLDNLDNERLALNIVEWLAFLDREPPVASFSFAPAQPMAGLYTTFDASASTDSLGTITKYAWSFGDGSTGSGKHVSHVYDRPGAYTVVLTVTDNDGMTASSTQQIEIIGSPPVAGFTVSPATPSIFEEVRFHDSSTDVNGEVVSWHWDFGDGGTSTERNPTHSYQEAGTFFATLTVTDNENLKDRMAKWVVVKHKDFIQADFTFYVVDESLHKVHLDASGSIDTMGTIVRYEWDWDGDGVYDTAVHTPAMIHRFDGEGPYEVILTIVDDQGNRASCTRAINSHG